MGSELCSVHLLKYYSKLPLVEESVLKEGSEMRDHISCVNRLCNYYYSALSLSLSHTHTHTVYMYILCKWKMM